MQTQDSHLNTNTITTSVKRKVRSRNRRRTRARSKTIAPRRLTKEEIRMKEFLDTVDLEKPKCRSQCSGGLRPCPFVSCRFNLFLDVTDSGSIKLNFPDLEIWELEDTCALDVAERGGTTLEEVGEIMNLTRERIRQIEVRGLLKLKMDPLSDKLEHYLK